MGTHKLVHLLSSLLVSQVLCDAGVCVCVCDAYLYICVGGRCIYVCVVHMCVSGACVFVHVCMDGCTRVRMCLSPLPYRKVEAGCFVLVRVLLALSIGLPILPASFSFLLSLLLSFLLPLLLSLLAASALRLLGGGHLLFLLRVHLPAALLGTITAASNAGTGAGARCGDGTHIVISSAVTRGGFLSLPLPRQRTALCSIR